MMVFMYLWENIRIDLGSHKIIIRMYTIVCSNNYTLHIILLYNTNEIQIL